MFRVFPIYLKLPSFKQAESLLSVRWLQGIPEQRQGNGGDVFLVLSTLSEGMSSFLFSLGNLFQQWLGLFLFAL